MSPPPLFVKGKELPILWENSYFTILNKPAGLASHPGPQARDSVEARLTPLKRGGPWLVHRLDTDTVGCLLIARRKTALIKAQEAFAKRSVAKIYWAIVQGVPHQPQGQITTPLRRVQQGGRWSMETASQHAPQAQSAETHWRLLGHNGTFSWLELTLKSGRTHQARLHCASIGLPIIGDTLYNPSAKQGPMHLLARSLHLTLEGETLSAEAPPPPAMQALLQVMTQTSS
ncbi:RNA pseudouridine synthase [Saccharibacter sp. 17.LH.SD]|uniref:RluA family pseudouridine synthase n=1 Tax=Saccharibacter sp. 17.LH.SD TaxID=2689393 RepID=UPI0013708093|nr:RluA family pseudouridine synthase [Saccharibacter sp. 17.LH.SD]MXV44932.1 RNA pseudouridine synthase [Saccharibacter sp. 17.LH.SD]